MFETTLLLLMWADTRTVSLWRSYQFFFVTQSCPHFVKLGILWTLMLCWDWYFDIVTWLIVKLGLPLLLVRPTNKYKDARSSSSTSKLVYHYRRRNKNTQQSAKMSEIQQKLSVLENSSLFFHKNWTSGNRYFLEI